MICVTGASGTLGSEVIRQLESLEATFRGAFFSKHKADAAFAKGIEAVVIDYNQPETLQAAFQGYDKLFLKKVTGREPRRFADFIRETAATGVWDMENP